MPENRRKRALTLTPPGLEVLRRSRTPTEAAYEELMASAPSSSGFCSN